MRDDVHDKAMALVDEGELLEAQGRMEAARDCFERAAQLEQQVADAVSLDLARTRGILRVSAVSAWMRARRYDDAFELARKYLGEPISPGFARELHELLCEIDTRLSATSRLPHIPDGDADQVVAVLLKIENDLAKGHVLRTRVTPAA